MRGGFVGFFLLIAVALLLRSTALTVLAARGVVLDVLVFVTVVWALRRGEASGTLLGFVLGLAADLDAGHWLGRHALALSLVGYATGRLGHTLVRDRTRTHLVLLVLATFSHQLWVAAFEISLIPSWRFALTRVVVSAVATAPLGALLLALLRRVYGRPIFPHAHLGSGSPG
ncbi:MAG: rod shape-determining protein MreD [Candidatus Eisenbacteria bacterium]